MATQVGVIKQITGKVVAVNANGAERILQAGDALFLGEVVKTAAGASVQVSMDNGKDLNILENDTVTIDQSTSVNSSFGGDAVADLSDLQKAILAGEDLTQLEETAAGGAQGGGGDAGGTGMLNESYFVQGGHESNVYGNGRNASVGNAFEFSNPINSIGTASSGLEV
ncbi:retention module-containing protein, partial [Campylobacter sp. 9BO]|uniref:retention module-containing protein n=1 Tax=Campylobacter sp. 9BO TaxID=3424759 RepID=UPI003D3323FA